MVSVPKNFIILRGSASASPHRQPGPHRGDKTPNCPTWPPQEIRSASNPPRAEAAVPLLMQLLNRSYKRHNRAQRRQVDEQRGGR